MSAERITSSMVHREILADLNAVADRIAHTQRKMATGRELTRPSDDPFAAGRALSLRTELDGVARYRRNAADAGAWIDASDTALAAIGDAAQRARELLLRGANGVAAQVERDTLADEIDQLVAGVKDEANATYAGRSLFAGTATGTKPYAAGSDAYAGNAGDVARSIGPGVAVMVNVRAADFLGNGADAKLLQSLRDAGAHLRGGTPADVAALGTTDVQALDRGLDDVLAARSQLGAIANRVQSADERLADLEVGVTGLLSEVEDADMAATMVDYSMQQAVYQSALRAGAGIVQTSLMDFLR